MKIRIIDNIKELEEYSDIWGEILKENNNNIFFLELDWIIRWWDIFGEDFNLMIGIVKHNDKTMGFCPLMSRKKGLNKEVTFIGYPQSTNMDFVVREEHREQTINAIGEYILKLKGHMIFVLSGFDSESQNKTLLYKYLRNVKNLQCTSKTPSLNIKILDNNFEKYYQHRFSGNRRKKMNKIERRLSELAEVSIMEIKECDIEKIFKLHTQRWKRKIDTSDFASVKCQKFFTRIALDNISSFKTQVLALYLNQRMIAFKFCFICNGQYLLYRGAHDDIFKIYTPGILLTKESIKNCFLNSPDIKILNFGIGYERYKNEWTDEKFEIFTLVFPNKNIVSKFVYILKFAKIKIREFLKSYKFIIHFKRNVLGKIKYIFSIENIKSNIVNFKSLVKKNGFASLITEICKKVIRNIYFKSNFSLLEMKNENLNIIETNKELILKMADVDDVYELANLMCCSAEKVVERIYRQNICLIAISKNKIIHYSWLLLDETIKTSDKIKIYNTENNTAYIYESFTDSQYNNIRIISSILNYLCNFMKNNRKVAKANMVNILLDHKNLEFKEAGKKIGFKITKNFQVVKIFKSTRMQEKTNYYWYY